MTKRDVAKRRARHLKQYPHKVRGVTDCWWYEEPEGIRVCVEAHNERGDVGFKCRMIQWRAIKAALERRERP